MVKQEVKEQEKVTHIAQLTDESSRRDFIAKFLKVSAAVVGGIIAGGIVMKPEEVAASFLRRRRRGGAPPRPAVHPAAPAPPRPAVHPAAPAPPRPAVHPAAPAATPPIQGAATAPRIGRLERRDDVFRFERIRERIREDALRLERRRRRDAATQQSGTGRNLGVKNVCYSDACYAPPAPPAPAPAPARRRRFIDWRIRI
ncbi:MAG: hypothetical protein DDT22_00841 [candidate division WS2 bacterium]|nr:hypothetical protein [Candidatus Lithacetigena glycinireducens]